MLFFNDNRNNIARMGRHNENRQKDNSIRIWYGLYIVALYIHLPAYLRSG